MCSKFIKLIVLLSLLVCCGFAGRVLYSRFVQSFSRKRERSTSQEGGLFFIIIIIIFFFFIPPKNPGPTLLLHHPKKGEPFFRQFIIT